jgi:hypothetical protein
MHGDWPAPEHTRAAAQMEATMRLLDEVDELRRDVHALRGEIGGRRAPVAFGVLLRVAVESGILVAVAVVAGVGHFRPLLTIALMGAALVAVVVSEWLASRSAYVPPRFGFVQARPLVVDPPAESPLESDGWERGLIVETEPARL